MMSIVSVASSYRIASLADHIGKVEISVIGCGLVGGSIALIPFATSFPYLLVMLAPLALGISFFILTRFMSLMITYILCT